MLYSKISPVQFIPLSYSMEEGANSPVRFAQSKIIRASDRSVISTVNLTDNGSGEFSNYSTVVPTVLQSENLYFEVITTLYTDVAYTQADPNYGVLKEVYLVKTEMGGAILGGREVYHDMDTEVLTKSLVKAFFSFNKMNEIKDTNSFASHFLSFIKEEKENKAIQTELKKDISSLSGLAKENFEEIINKFFGIMGLFNSLKEGMIKNLKTEIGNIKFEDKTDELKEEFAVKLDDSNSSIMEKFDDLNNQMEKLKEEINEMEEAIKSGDMFSKSTKELPELAKQLKDVHQSIKDISTINSKMKELMIDIKLNNAESLSKLEK